jgi:hypothetical protein
LASTVQKIHRIATHVGTTVGEELDGVAATKMGMLGKQLVEVNFAIENISAGTAVVNDLIDAGAPVSCQSERGGWAGGWMRANMHGNESVAVTGTPYLVGVCRRSPAPPHASALACARLAAAATPTFIQ